MLASEIKTASDLRDFVEEVGGNKLFFSRKTMSFFGDTMKNYGIRLINVQGVNAWELYRRHPVKCGNQASAYFHAETFRRLHLPV